MAQALLGEQPSPPADIHAALIIAGLLAYAPRREFGAAPAADVVNLRIYRRTFSPHPMHCWGAAKARR